MAERVETPSVYVNEKGETCIGSKCFVVKLSEHDADVVDIEFRDDECDDAQRDAIRKVKERILDGAGTRYEFTKKRR